MIPPFPAVSGPSPVPPVSPPVRHGGPAAGHGGTAPPPAGDETLATLHGALRDMLGRILRHGPLLLLHGLAGGPLARAAAALGLPLVTNAQARPEAVLLDDAAGRLDPADWTALLGTAGDHLGPRGKLVLVAMERPATELQAAALLLLLREAAEPMGLRVLHHGTLPLGDLRFHHLVLEKPWAVWVLEKPWAVWLPWPPRLSGTPRRRRKGRRRARLRRLWRRLVAGRG